MYASTYALVLDIIHQQCIIYVYIAEGLISIQRGIIKILNSCAVALLPTCMSIKKTGLNDILPLLSHDFCFTIPIVFLLCSHVTLFLCYHIILIHVYG